MEARKERGEVRGGGNEEEEMKMPGEKRPGGKRARRKGEEGRKEEAEG